MGDRGIITFDDGDVQFAFYSHWHGSELAQVAASVLAQNPGVVKRIETGDLTYGFRGIIHGLLLHCHPDGVEETGSGIGSLYMMDTSDNGVVAEFNKDRTVTFNGFTVAVHQFAALGEDR